MIKKENEMIKNRAKSIPRIIWNIRKIVNIISFSWWQVQNCKFQITGIIEFTVIEGQMEIIESRTISVLKNIQDVKRNCKELETISLKDYDQLKQEIDDELQALQQEAGEVDCAKLLHILNFWTYLTILNNNPLSNR